MALARYRADVERIIDTCRGNAADGILGPHLEKEASFYTVKEVFSPVYIETRRPIPVAEGLIPADKIVSHILGLSEIHKAFNLMERAEALRVVLQPRP